MTPKEASTLSNIYLYHFAIPLRGLCFITNPSAGFGLLGLYELDARKCAGLADLWRGPRIQGCGMGRGTAAKCSPDPSSGWDHLSWLDKRSDKNTEIGMGPVGLTPI